jgi:hypothetical protein
MLITRAVSFDHLVGAGEQGERDFKAERFCGLEIEDQFELGRPYDGWLAGFSPTFA